MTICIVSPHLDDAVLSCGIKIQRARAEGKRVIIANIFSKGTNSDNRQAEEAKVAKAIGAEPYFLNELDAPDRDENFTTSQQIFFGPLADVDDSFINHIQNRLEDFFKTHDVEKAYFPLGAGNHIDHRIVHAAGRKIGSVKARYYEDRPYILWPGILQSRMNRLKLESDVEPADVEDMQESLGHYYYHTKLPKGAFGPENLKKYLAGLTPPEQWTGKAYRREELEAREDELHKMYKALALYDSQMPLIYPDYETFMRDSLAHEHHRTGRKSYVERHWMIEN